MVVFFNLFSLFFGAAALLLPLASLMRPKRKQLLSFLGLSSGMISLCGVLCGYHARVLASDWSALLDTSQFLIGISLGFTVLTVILNLLLLLRK